MEGNILNGMSEVEIADKIYGVGALAWKLNLGRAVNHWVREKLKSATEKALGSTVNNLRKIADGFTIMEKEFSSSPKGISLDGKRNGLIDLLKESKDEEFWRIILDLTDYEGENKIKIRLKEVPPDFRANQLILQAHSPEVWDLEGNRKKIPDVKIIVGIEGETARKYLKKPIKADFEVLTSGN